ncbi:hypothetical protein PAHAL_3G479400 [Panicum hallii]|uniref:HTH myb-type domain-containing protein n=1 Tax=Panicum hallii TaxID=206008 RepID=A0A2S3HF01_9POAL|nr:transcription factor NIGTH1-like [Panicum hallii]PAN21603.1 hypothetical protein PAHAL_3G479400 [Panicum hallii]
MMARKEDHHHHHLRALAARAVTDSLRAAAPRSATAAERAARFEDCVRSLEAEKAKMEVFRRELPISVHLVADVIEWLKEELAQHRRPAPAPAPAPTPELFAPVAAAPAAAKRKAAPEGGTVKAEADANDKRSWMSSAQLWSCGSHDASSTATANGGAAAKPSRKVSDAFLPRSGLPTLGRSPDDAAEKPAALPVPDLTLSSPAIDAACPAAPSATSSAVTDGGAAAQRLRQRQQQQQQQAQQRKARRCWSPELHRRFVAALQRLGGAQVATPKQIRELMKVDGLTNDEVKSHLQKYRLHTRRASSSDGCDLQVSAAAACPWPAPEQQYTTSQHSTSQSGSPQGPLQLTVSSRAMSATAGDSCDGDEAEGGGSESYGFGAQHGTKASSS